MQKSSVKDHENLVRDPVTGVIKNKNRAAFLAARNRKKAVIDRKINEEQSISKISDLENQISELKTLIETFIASSNSNNSIKKTTKKKVLSSDNNTNYSTEY